MWRDSSKHASRAPGAEAFGLPFLIFSWAVVILVAAVSLVPGNLRPHLLFSSKLEHVVAYAFVAAVLSIGIKRPLHLLAIGILLPAYAAALECAQLWVPGRDPKLIDVAAGAVGSSLAVASVFLIKRFAAPKRNLMSLSRFSGRSESPHSE